MKYGWNNFSHKILYENLTLEEAGIIEKKLIEELQLTNPKYGYNLREGGNGKFNEHSRQLMSQARLGNKNNLGNKMSQEQKDKISKSLKIYYLTHDNGMKGKHHSEETKCKLSQRIISNETREKMKKNHANVSGANNPSAKSVQQLDKNGNLIKEFPYATLAAKELNLDLSSIIKCCRGKNKTCGGYIWRYTNKFNV